MSASGLNRPVAVIPSMERCQSSMVGSSGTRRPVEAYSTKTRPNGEIEDDLMLFPGEQTFERVPECTTGRVFLMNLHGRKRFFWIQELKEDKDEENLKKVCDILKNGR